MFTLSNVPHIGCAGFAPASVKTANFEEIAADTSTNTLEISGIYETRNRNASHSYIDMTASSEG
jgi:hypothetical protein